MMQGLEQQKPLTAPGLVPERNQVTAPRTAPRDEADPHKDVGNGENPPADSFNAETQIEKLGIWWLNGGDRYYLPNQRPGDPPGWLDMGASELRRVLKVTGIRTNAAAGDASPADQLLVETMKTRAVDYAVSVAGKRAGVVKIGTSRVLIRDSPRLIEPAEGDYSTIAAFLEGLLSGGRQLDYFFGWLKVALEALMNEEQRPGQALIVPGPSDCGKSRLQHQIITPILGGRPADPKSYFFGRTDFNNELIGSEHLLIEEIPPGTRYDDRQLFGERIKEVVANDTARLHKKNRDAVTVYPFWRLSISLNDSADKLRMLPPITIDMRDKLLILAAKPCPDFWEQFAEAHDPRAAFRDAIARELPAFVHGLLEWRIPADIVSRRFGIRAYQDQELLDALLEHEHESHLLLLIDKELFEQQDDRQQWEGDMQDLKEKLTNETSTVRGSAQKLTADLGFLGTMMKKLSEQHPQRVEQMPRKANKRPWKIFRPPDE